MPISTDGLGTILAELGGATALDDTAGLASTLYIDAATPISLADQDGSVGRPYATVTAAVAHANASLLASWIFQVGFGTYSGEAAITIPQNKRYVFAGTFRSAASAMLPAFNWTVTGTNSSTLLFRNIVVGALTIADGVVPGVQVSLIYENCLCMGISAPTLASVLFIVFSGNAHIGNNSSLTISLSIVRQPVDVNGARIFATNTYFEATCTTLRGGEMFFAGCLFIQAITSTLTLVECRSSIWRTVVPSIVFTGSAGTARFDSDTHYAFHFGGGGFGTVTNGVAQAAPGLRQGLAVQPAGAGVLSSASVYNALVLGSVTDGDPYGAGGNGALFACARAGTEAVAPTNAPFTCFTGWDFGSAGFDATALDSGRICYYGGGGWQAPDAHSHQFYTAPTYSEANDQGVLRFQIRGDGAVSIPCTALGVFGTAPIAKPTVTGSRGGNAALASLLTALADLGLITNSSTA